DGIRDRNVTGVQTCALPISPGPRIRRAWEAMAVEQIPFTLLDGAEGWLAIADADQLDQVLWALLDNAVKYGERSPVEVELAVDRSEEHTSELQSRFDLVCRL